MPCPKCGGTLKYNQSGISKTTGKRYKGFIGCSTFPICKWSQSLKNIGDDDY